MLLKDLRPLSDMSRNSRRIFLGKDFLNRISTRQKDESYCDLGLIALNFRNLKVPQDERGRFS
jgi:hypothetical protein